jgi:hypothetical protein
MAKDHRRESEKAAPAELDTSVTTATTTAVPADTAGNTATDVAVPVAPDTGAPGASTAVTATVPPRTSLSMGLSKVGDTPADLSDLIEEDSGKGVSTSASDNVVPMVAVFQALSPQCDDASPKHVRGARQGCIWLRNSTIEVVSGETGIVFQPCFFEKGWPEWVPRAEGGGQGGGFRARHDNREATRADVQWSRDRLALGEDIPDVDLTDDYDFVLSKKGFNDWFRPRARTQLKLTRYHVGRVLAGDGWALPYIIPLTGSGHAVSKAWMYSMGTRKLPNGRPEPSFMRAYRLTTRKASNADGTWWLFSVAEGGCVSRADYLAGRELNRAFTAGEAVMERDDAAGTDDAFEGSSRGGANSSTGADDVPY